MLPSGVKRRNQPPDIRIYFRFVTALRSEGQSAADGGIVD